MEGVELSKSNEGKDRSGISIGPSVGTDGVFRGDSVVGVFCEDAEAVDESAV